MLKDVSCTEAAQFGQYGCKNKQLNHGLQSVYERNGTNKKSLVIATTADCTERNLLQSLAQLYAHHWKAELFSISTPGIFDCSLDLLTGLVGTTAMQSEKNHMGWKKPPGYPGYPLLPFWAILLRATTQQLQKNPSAAGSDLAFERFS